MPTKSKARKGSASKETPLCIPLSELDPPIREALMARKWLKFPENGGPYFECPFCAKRYQLPLPFRAHMEKSHRINLELVPMPISKPAAPHPSQVTPAGTAVIKLIGLLSLVLDELEFAESASDPHDPRAKTIAQAIAAIQNAVDELGTGFVLSGIVPMGAACELAKAISAENKAGKAVAA